MNVHNKVKALEDYSKNFKKGDHVWYCNTILGEIERIWPYNVELHTPGIIGEYMIVPARWCRKVEWGGR